MTFLKVKIFLIPLFTTIVFSQNTFLVETSVTASFKMGSMKSESKILYTEQDYFSKVKFSFKGKGVAKLMSRDMHSGTIISFQDSSMKKIDYKKKKFTSRTLQEIIAEKKENLNSGQNDNSETNDDEIEKFMISDVPEIINGFEAYKLMIGDSNNTQIWFTNTSTEPIFVKIIKEQVNKFENNWFNFSGNFAKYGIDENAVIVKFFTKDDDGSFDFNLITHEKISFSPEVFKIPKNFKKVRKL